MRQYELTPKAFWGKSSPRYVIRLAPRDLFNRYGLPINDGDSESLGTYVFTARSGAVVTIYARANDVWSLLLGVVRPVFWRSSGVIELSIGASKVDEGLAFARWLSAEFRCPYQRWPSLGRNDWEYAE